MEKKNMHDICIIPLQGVPNVKKTIERCKFGQETE
jgi:hypothetical protein